MTYTSIITLIFAVGGIVFYVPLSLHSKFALWFFNAIYLLVIMGSWILSANKYSFFDIEFPAILLVSMVGYWTFVTGFLVTKDEQSYD